MNMPQVFTNFIFYDIVILSPKYTQKHKIKGE